MLWVPLGCTGGWWVVGEAGCLWVHTPSECFFLVHRQKTEKDAVSLSGSADMSEDEHDGNTQGPAAESRPGQETAAAATAAAPDTRGDRGERSNRRDQNKLLERRHSDHKVTRCTRKVTLVCSCGAGLSAWPTT